MNAEPATIECPVCGSTFVEYLLDPDVHDIVRGTRGVMLSCQSCKHIFAISPEQAKRFGGESPGEAIATDRPCPSCGYNLKTLLVGNRCPECGNTIEPKLFQSKRFSLKTLIGVGVIVLVLIIGARALALGSLYYIGFPGALWIIGPICLLNGIHGLCTGSISVGKWPFENEVSGWRARVWSLIWLAFGVGLTLLPFFL